MNKIGFTASECKQARQGLCWSRDRLSEAASVGKRTIIDFENQTRQPVDSTKRSLKEALENAGVVFGDGQIRIPIISMKGADQ